MVCCAALALLSCAAMSAQITNSFRVDPDSPAWMADFDLPQFDSSLGTLESVRFVITTDWVGTLQGENLVTKSGGSTSGKLNWDQVFTGAGSQTWALSGWGSVSANVAKFDGVKDFGGTSGWTVDFSGTFHGSDFGSEYATDLTPYIGTGTITCTLETNGDSQFVGTSKWLSYADQTLGTDVKVEYEYKPVPEPSSLVAFVSLLGGLSGIVLRRRKG